MAIFIFGADQGHVPCDEAAVSAFVVPTSPFAEPPNAMAD
jgi:hypothetical protein